VTPLSGKYGAMFYHGESWELRGYASRFAARRAIVTHAVNRGWSADDCRRELLNPAYPGSQFWTNGQDGRELTPAEAERRVREDHRACAAYVADRPTYRHAAEVRQEMSVLTARIAARPWPGRTGRTDRDVLAGLLTEMLDVGTDRINYAVRDAMLNAGVKSPDTGNNALRRLEKDGWVERTPVKGWGMATEYKSLVGARLQRDRTEAVGVDREPGDATPTAASHEAWLHLGKACKAIYEALTSEPQGIREIARRASVSPSTASSNLPKLASVDMAVKTDDGWVIGAGTPDDYVYWHGYLGDASVTQKLKDRVSTDRMANEMKRNNKVTVEDLPELEAPALPVPF
jgi:predicted transcriptional regulator